MTGEGKYDRVCTLVREVTEAKHVIIIVFDGIMGTGYSAQSVEPVTLRGVPVVLREVADQIEADLATRQ